MDTKQNSLMMLFAGNACKKLAGEIASKLGLELSKADVGTFSDGECSVSICDSVRGRDVFVVQSTSEPVNNNLMEMLIMIDALKRASAGRITAVMPYFGYARQDRKAKSRDPITAKLVADLISAAGASRVLTMDLHAAQLQGFFNIPVDHLFGQGVLYDYLKNQTFVKENSKKNDLIVVSPDVGSVARARQFATRINAPIAIVDKRRPQANKSEVMNIIGDTAGKVCLILDDMVDTAGTLCNGAEAIMKLGKAKEVYACCTHGVLSGPAIERIDNSPIKKLFILDTIEQPSHRKSPKIQEISVAKLFADSIKNVHCDLPLSDLY
ncbi:MAG: ribose-phosphate pyrophosphokinase [Firmicutes bacterium]|nr:ribose-phosphate pyrophosphokinase [Bacillota bacterium]